MTTSSKTEAANRHHGRPGSSHQRPDLPDPTLGRGAKSRDPISTSTNPDMQQFGDDHGTPGDQERPMTEDEKLEKALEDSFPTSDPIQPSRIDGPNN